VSLGCAKNLVDGEIMLGALLREGVEIVNDPGEADAVIVNTCSFIDAAREESVDAILESARFRDEHVPYQALIVSGCLPQRFRDELPKLLPEVDAFIGVDQVEKIGEIVDRAVASRQFEGARLKKVRRGSPRRQPGSAPAAEVEVSTRPTYIPHWDSPRYRLTPSHFAYLKIAEGCNHPCSFCIIPRMRGSHRSRAQADIVEEARRLLGQGVRELNLISQDSTYYGMDLRPNASRAIASPERFTSATRAVGDAGTTLCTLLRELNSLSGEFWIRLLYTHPAHWTDELIATLAECPKVARYVDMPLQHIHDDMLLRMRRETSGAYIRDLIARIRAGIPGIALRTTFIVGFPGETEEHFETLLEFMRSARFERLGAFTYSQEEGTVAGKMAGHVPLPTRNRRRDRAMAFQREIAAAIHADRVGRTIRVLVEGSISGSELAASGGRSWEHGAIRSNGNGHASTLPSTNLFSVARAEADAPDIDGRVYVRGALPAGQFANVRIVGHSDYDLVAELA
jgi:ribosomal protein S12 methylthiotransferase